VTTPPPPDDPRTGSTPEPPDTAPAGRPAAPDVIPVCPNCGAASEGASACDECGYLFAVPDSLPVWEQERWEVVVRADRDYFDAVEPEGMAFPEVVHTRRIPLTGDAMWIGRRSASKGTSPQIDLTGTLEDVGVSHRHGLLMRQPDGEWALVDRGSTNGTFLNSFHDPVPPFVRIPLRDGDRIHLGAWTSLTVERSEAVPEQAPDEDLPSKDTRTVARGRLGLEVGLLGPLRLVVSEQPQELGAPKARAVLAVLALRIGTPVSTGDLEWALWGDRQPPTAAKALQGHVSALRKVLPKGAIETAGQGYRLLGPRDVVDVFRFERRSGRARELLATGHPGAAVAEAERALALWRGDPVPDLVDGPTGAGEVARLVELRALAEEDLVEGRLQLGDHLGVLPDAVAAVDREPLRERRWGQLMLAYHRAGRQVEALRAYQQVREVLGDEFGVEPSAELAALEQAVALDDPGLAWVPPGA